MAKRRLTLEETKKCLIAWRELGDKKACEFLIINNEALIVYFVKRYLGKGLEFDELKSAGFLGLQKAINAFDYVNHPIETFSTYISMAIDNEIKREFKRYNKHSHVLSFDEPIAHNKDGDELTVEDLLGTDADQLIEDVISEMKIDIVKNALSCLTSREQQIIFLRYGLDDAHRKTQEEVAQIFGCSKTNIMRQEQKAITKMRHPRNTRKLKDFID